jgi:hypothetical protein
MDGLINNICLFQCLQIGEDMKGIYKEKGITKKKKLSYLFPCLTWVLSSWNNCLCQMADSASLQMFAIVRTHSRG